MFYIFFNVRVKFIIIHNRSTFRDTRPHPLHQREHQIFIGGREHMLFTIYYFTLTFNIKNSFLSICLYLSVCCLSVCDGFESSLFDIVGAWQEFYYLFSTPIYMYVQYNYLEIFIPLSSSRTLTVIYWIKSHSNLCKLSWKRRSNFRTS